MLKLRLPSSRAVYFDPNTGLNLHRPGMTVGFVDDTDTTLDFRNIVLAVTTGALTLESGTLPFTLSSGRGSGGPSNLVTHDYTAEEPITEHAIVWVTTENSVGVADNTAACFGKVVGMALEAADTGGSVSVCKMGVVSLTESLQVGDTYYVGTSGGIQTTVPEEGFIQSVGIAVDTNDLYVSFSDPIALQS